MVPVPYCGKIGTPISINCGGACLGHVQSDNGRHLVSDTCGSTGHRAHHLAIGNRLSIRPDDANRDKLCRVMVVVLQFLLQREKNSLGSIHTTGLLLRWACRNKRLNFNLRNGSRAKITVLCRPVEMAPPRGRPGSSDFYALEVAYAPMDGHSSMPCAAAA